MRYFVCALALFIVLTSIPLVSNAQTQSPEQLAAQAEALLRQIAALQAQLAAQSGGVIAPVGQVVPTTSSALCPNIGRVLKLGSTGDDVSRLQRFLAADPSIYPEALVTGYYGPLTEAAVKRWQTKFNIVSSGDAESTGFGVAGPRTAAAIALQCSTISGGANTNITSPTVGGFIQVTPISGNAPLTVSVTATVNTVNSCEAAAYTLEWGDGTIAQTIQVPAHRCGSLQQTFSHQYVYGGQYLVRLSAGQHSTTATVQVFGAGAPATGAGTGAVTTPTSQSLPASLSVTIPFAGQTVQRGSTVSVSWNASGGVPQNSQVQLDLVNLSGQVVGSPIIATSNLVGSHSWQVPTNVPGGQYKIRARILQVGGNTIVTTESNAFAIPEPFSYGPLAVSPGVSNNPLAIGVSFNIPTSCTGYSLSWGDGTASATQTHGTSCAETPVTRIFTHEYAASGTYTLTLRRGADLSHIDTASISISN
jgi:peptidoglycan hydrolase-like protein with peptidoglycan-binding domain